MTYKSGDSVMVKDLTDSSWIPGKVVSVNGPNIWVMTDSGRQVLRWDHEVKPRANSESKDS